MFGWPNSQSTNLANNITCLQSNLLSRAKAPPAKRNRRLWGGEWKPSNCLRSKKDGSYRLFLSLFLTVAAIWILNTQSSGGYEPFVPRPENNPVRSEDSIKFLRIFYTVLDQSAVSLLFLLPCKHHQLEISQQSKWTRYFKFLSQFLVGHFQHIHSTTRSLFYRLKKIINRENHQKKVFLFSVRSFFYH